jgi:hypothetical protein
MTNVFIENCKNGNLEEICEQFQENTAKQNRTLVAFNFYQGFRYACEHGHLNVANLLLTKIKKTDQRNSMFAASDEYAFRHACANGHGPMVQWILENHSGCNIHILDNYALKKACFNQHYDTVVKQLLPLTHQSTLLVLFNERDTLSDETKIFMVDWIRKHPDKITHVKRIFSHMCIGGNILIAQYIYEKLDSPAIIYTNQWDTIFRRTSYNYKFGTGLKIKYLNVLQWLQSLFSERYFVKPHMDAAVHQFSKCFILPLCSRSKIPDDLVQEKTRCDLCKTVDSDLVGPCGHQYCTPCTVGALTHPDAIYPFCAYCQLHMDACYPSTYDYALIRKNSLEIKSDLVKDRFHPRNIPKFKDWGIDGFSDYESSDEDYV